MSALNTFRKTGSSRWLLLLIMLLCALGSGHALDGTREANQYLRREWDARQVFDGASISALAQTPDGYLWISTSKNLYRFDGRSFEVVHPSGTSMASITNVLEFVVDAQGGLWMWLQDARLFCYRADKLSLILGNTQTVGNATAIAPSNDGGVLIATLGQGLLAIHGDTKRQLKGETKGFVAAIAQSRDGNVWLGTHDEGLYSYTAGQLHRIRDKHLDTKINALLSSSRGDLWIGTDNGLALWDGEHITTPKMVDTFRHMQVLGLLEDRDHNVWVTTIAGVFRLNPAGDVRLMKKEQESNMEASVLEDRERSIWIGDARGLVQLRDGIFNSYGPSDSVFVDPGGPVFVDERENLWSAPASGGISVHGRDGTRKLPAAGLSADVVYSIDGLGPDVWLGRQRGGLTHLHVESGNVTAQTFTKADGLPQNTIYTVRLSKDGSVWAGSLTGGVSHLRDGNFKTYTAADGLASDDVSAIEEGDAGAMWFGTSSGLSSLSAGHWHSYSTADGLPSNEVLCLFRDHAGSLWIGTKGVWLYGRMADCRVLWGGIIELS